MTERFDPSKFSVSLNGVPVLMVNQRKALIQSAAVGLCVLLSIQMLPFNHWFDWTVTIFFSLSALFRFFLGLSSRVINIYGFNRLTHGERVWSITQQLRNMPGHHDRHVAVQVRAVDGVTGIFACT